MISASDAFRQAYDINKFDGMFTGIIEACESQIKDTIERGGFNTIIPIPVSASKDLIAAVLVYLKDNGYECGISNYREKNKDTTSSCYVPFENLYISWLLKSEGVFKDSIKL